MAEFVADWMGINGNKQQQQQQQVESSAAADGAAASTPDGRTPLGSA